MPWWAGKDEIKTYLEKVNENGKVRISSHPWTVVPHSSDSSSQILEYTLFQPGLFLDYLAFPYKTAKYLTPLNTMIDFQNRRAIVVDGHADDTIMTLTTVQDLAAVVARAADYDGEWPVIGGISGNRVSVSQILKFGQKFRGHPFVVDTVKLEDLENGRLKTSWSLEARHPSFTGEQVDKALKNVLIGTLVSSAKGGWDVSDEFNQLLPNYKFTEIEEFLAKVWEHKS